MVIDGLRPSAIDTTAMPFLQSLMRQGSHYPHAFAAFPSLTRANAATVATGCLPGSTRILGNHVWHPQLGHVDTADAEGIRRLRSYGAMPQASLAERLARAGRSAVVVGNGSAGCTYTLNPGTDGGHGTTIASVGPAANVFSALPSDARTALIRLGPPPAADDEALDWAVAAAVTSIATMSPDLLIFWSGQPDTVQHATGPSSAASLRMLSRVDSAVRALHTAATADGRACNAIVTADHGICDTSDSVELSDAFDAITAGIGLAPDDVVLAYNGGAVFGYFRAHVGHRDRRRYVDRLAGQPWAGPVFCADEYCPETAFPISLAIGNASPFVPDLIVTTRSNASDPHRVDNVKARACHARPAGGPAELGVHGTVHPDDLRIPLILHGPAFRSHTRQTLPAGTVDIAPTAYALVTGEEMPEVDGRVLVESFLDRGERPPPPVIRVHQRGVHQLAFAESADLRHLIGGSSGSHRAPAETEEP